MHQICLTVASLNQETNFTFLKYSFEDQNARAIILCVLYHGKTADPIMHNCKTQNQTAMAKNLPISK